MALPPAWKVRRELWRIREQVRHFVSPIKDVPRQAIYDRFTARKLPIHDGAVGLDKKVAIVVLFQPKGLAGSSLFTLDHLTSKGWSPVVISNAPVSDSDRSALRARSAIFLERRNIGYDFGGYRDGIRLLSKLQHEPNRLILMNDSTWFPLREGDQTIERIEALDADLAGHILKIEDHKRRGQDHVESHLLMFSNRLVRSDCFRRFWNDYTMTDIRELTIENGEKGLGKVAFDNGFTVDAILTPEKILTILSGLDDEALLAAMTKLIPSRKYVSDNIREFSKRAERGEPWRDSFFEWVLLECRHSISFAFTHLAATNELLGFAKKSNDRCFHDVRKNLIALEAEGRIKPFHPAVACEMKEALKSWVPRFDWRLRPEDRADMEEERLGAQAKI